ncbi:MAG: BamA/TamA family outer membrane protein [Luteitalea sp.]|nr:BamA/TamA family outer membrane protein [Luteitalea sp.]
MPVSVRLLRIGLVIAAGLLLVLTLFVALLHTPLVRGRVAAWATAMLQRDYGIDARIGRLDYNLLSLSIELADVRLAAAGREAPAFFTARHARVDLPWAFVGGAARLQSLSVDHAAIVIERAQDGRWNLPELAAREPAPSSSAIDLGRLDLRDISFRFTDPSLGTALELSRLSLVSRATPGPAAWRPADLAANLRAETGGQPLEARVEGALRLTSEGLNLEPLVLTTAHSRIEGAGVMRLFASEPACDLRYRVEADLTELTPLLPGQGIREPDPETAPTLPMRGIVQASGTVKGELAAPRIEVDLSSDSLAYADLRQIRLQSRASIDPTRVIVRHLRAAVGAGEVAVRGTVGLDQGVRSEIDSTWRGLDVATFLSSVAGPLPVDLATRAAGTVRVEGPGLDWPNWEVSVHAALTPTASSKRAARPRPVPVAGTLALTVAKRQWSLTPDLAAEGLTLRGRVGGELSDMRSPAEADFTAEPVDGSLSGGLALHAADVVPLLDVAGVVLPTGERIHGSLDARVDLTGSFRQPRVNWSLTSRDLTSSSHGAGQLDARGTATTTRATVASLRLMLEESQIDGRATVSFRTGRVEGFVQADVPEVAALLRAMPAERRPTGTVKMSGRLAGTTTRLMLDAAVTSSNLRAAGQRLDSLNAQVQLTPDSLRIERLTATQDPSGLLEATGSYTLSSGRYELDARGQDLRIDPPPDGSDTAASIPVGGRVSFEARGEGALAHPSGAARLTLSDFTWRGAALGPIEATVDADGQRAVIDARASSFATELHAIQALDEARSFELTARVEGLDVERLSPFLPNVDLPIAGRLSLGARANGRLDNLAETEGSATLTETNVMIGDSRLALAAPAALRYSPRGLAVEGLDLASGASHLTVDGSFGLGVQKEETGAFPATEKLHARLDARAADLLPIVKLFSTVPFGLTGSLQLDANATGTLRAPRLAGTLSLIDTSVTYRDLPPVTNLGLEAHLGEGLLTIDQLTGTWQRATIAGTGSLPLRLLARWLPEPLVAARPATPDEARLQVTASPLTPALLEPFIDDLTTAQVDGELALSLDARATALDLAAVNGTLTLDRGNLVFAGLPVEQVAPTRISIDNGRALIEMFSWRGPGTELRVTGSASGLDHQPVVELNALGNLDLRLLGAFARDIGTAGSATIDVRATGPVTTPELDGRIDVTEGELVLREPRLLVSDVAGAIQLDEQRISAIGITGMANGGPIRLDATLDVGQLPAVTGIATITGRNVAFEYPEGLRAELNADMRVEIRPRETLIGGDVTLLHGSYREPIILTGTLGRELFGGGGQLGGMPSGGGSSAAATPVRLDIAVISQEDLLVDNNYGRFGAALDLQLLGTLDQPGVAGRIELREGGELYLGGLVYRIERGSADFTDPARLDPTLDLVAQTHVGATGVTIQASGTPETLDVTVESDDAQQSEAELYAMLAGGGAGESTTEAVRTQLLSAISGDLFALAGRTIGLDALRLERGIAAEDIGSEQVQLATEANPAARLTAAKRFPRGVELILSQSLREAGALTWIASYRPLRSVELRAVSRDDESRAYEFRHDVTLGRRTRRVDSGAQRGPGQRVTAVIIRGVSEADERQLARRLKLEAGDRFDFYRWQKDRDRLAEYLREQGYFEHRIRTSRQSQEAPVERPAQPAAGPEAADEAPGVTLYYTIETGPQCEVVVRGSDLPGNVRRRMRDAWSAAVFDTFLSDDLTAIARRHLIETNHPQARVQVRIDARQEVKQAIVTVEPGPVSPWRLEYTGNDQASTAAIDAFIRERDLALTAWLDPPAFERSLAEWYRAQGYLAALARVGIDARSSNRGGQASRGREVILPVEIREGPLYSVASVDVSGVEAETAAQVRQWFGIAPGSAYLPLDAELGRRNVEAAYRNDGFANATVSLGVDVEPRRSGAEAGRVLLNLDVAEGPRQVLEDVAIRGAPGTDEPVILRALSLERGAPIGVRTMLEARQRLYETGVFQRVDISLQPIERRTQSSSKEVVTEQPVRAIVELQERPRYRLRYGVGVNDEPSSSGSGREVTPGLAADLENRNLFGTTATGGIAGRYQRRRQAGRLFLTLPRLFDAPLSTTLFVERSREGFDVVSEAATFEATTDETEYSIFQRLRLRRREGLAVEYGYTYARSRTRVDSPDFPDEPVTVPRLGASVIVDRRDDASDATRGWLHSSTFEYSDTWLASDLRFVRYVAQQYYFRRLTETVVSASALRVGATRAIGDQVLIPSEMFQIGGGQTLRGYPDGSIVGEDFLAENALLLINQELRFPIYRWVRGVGFVDAGNVFDAFSDLSLDLEVGVGAGLRIDTPFALFRVDVGVPLTRDVDGRRRPRLYFSLGQAF